MSCGRDCGDTRIHGGGADARTEVLQEDPGQPWCVYVVLASGVLRGSYPIVSDDQWYLGALRVERKCSPVISVIRVPASLDC